MTKTFTDLNIKEKQVFVLKKVRHHYFYFAAENLVPPGWAIKGGPQVKMQGRCGNVISGSHCVTEFLIAHENNKTGLNCGGTSHCGASPCASTSGLSFEVAGVPSMCPHTCTHNHTQPDTVSPTLVK